jgi:hypothetical protein
MIRACKIIWAVCLFSLSTALFADTGSVYPTSGPPDIDVINLTGTFNGTNLTFHGTSTYSLPDGSLLTGGAVEALSDLPGTYCGASNSPCLLSGLALVFNADQNGFTISGQTVEAFESSQNYTGPAGQDTNPADSATTIYLSGSFVAGSYVNQNNAGIEFGELFTVTYENQTEMNELESDPQFMSAVGTKPASNLVGDTVFFDYDSTFTDGDMEINPTPEPATFTLLCSGLAAGLLRKKLARKKSVAETV